MLFLNILENNTKSFPERVAICLNHDEYLLTYKNLWEISGKVYSYLKNNNIGREDFVLVNMPRDPRTYACVIGIMRAGAAFVIAQTTYPKDRINFIKTDSNAKFVITEDVYSEILNEKIHEGYEEIDKHDAAFAVYTSGTTGTPKGVLHEYGNIELEVSYYKTLIKNNYEKFASILSFNFVAFVMELTWQLTLGNSIFILDEKISKNLESLIDFVETEKIESLHMPPSLVRNIKKFPSSVKRIMIGTEPANGIYFDNIEITNKYAQSETYFTVANILLNKKYDKAPVGKNPHGIEIKILGDEGCELPNGNTGEICFKNTFFRGYINLVEQTKYAFRNNIYHTGDLGFKDDYGNLIISGRKDDMIKINGYRIEPAEIEAAGKKLLGVSQTISKGFIEDDGRAYVVLYYVREPKTKKLSRTEESIILNKFSEILPSYMTPTYLVEIDKIPTVPNGKADRKALKKPDTKNFRADYVTPKGKTETILCDMFSKVLKIDKVGVNDDFYMLGGDSITCMEVVTNIGLQNLSTTDIFKGRTAKKIAEIYELKKNENNSNIKSSLEIQKKLVKEKNKENYIKYSKTGIIESLYSLMFLDNFVVPKNPEQGIAIEYTLHEIVDLKKLQESLNFASKICLYITFSIEVIKEKPIVHFLKNDNPIKIHNYNDDVLFGSKKNNEHYVLVKYKKNKVRFCVSHVLTDGTGLMRFVKAVFDYYFEKRDTSYIDMRNSYSSITDLMENEIPLSTSEKEFAANLFKQYSYFVIPEEPINNPEELFKKSLIIKKEKLYKFANEHELSVQLAIVLLLSVSIQNLNINNDKDICIRIPVDSRIALGAKDTFQNASYPHIAFNLNPKYLISDDFSKAAEMLNKQFEDKFSYAYLGEFTNRISHAIKSKDINDIINFVTWYVGLSDIFVSYLGKLDSDEWNDYVKDVALQTNSNFKITIYLYEYKDYIGIEYFQCIKNEEYFNNFMDLINSLKI